MSSPIIILSMILLISSPISRLLLVSAHKTINATDTYNVSDDTNFQFMVNLLPSSTLSSEGKSLYFYWNTPSYQKQQQGKVLKCRMVYQSLKSEQEQNYEDLHPSYIALGIQDVNKENAYSSEKMIGANAIVGSLEYGIAHYELNNIYEGPGGVEEVQSLNSNNNNKMTLFVENESDLDLKFGENDNNLEYNYKVVYDLTLFVDGEDNNKSGITSTTSQKSIYEKGENLFIFAIGPSSTPLSNLRLGRHVKAGSFLLDLNKVSSSKEHRYDNMENNNHECKSDDSNYNYMIELPGNAKFYWTLDPFDEILNVQLTHLGNAWLALGIPENEEGRMVGANAVIGNPALTYANGDKPLKYHLSSKQQSGVYPMIASKQTLIDAVILQEDGETILRFTKMLYEDDEHPIDTTSMTTFIYAMGQGNMLSFHSYANSFKVDLTECGDKGDDKSIFLSSWIIHGLFGSLAFAVFMPIFISTAFLRKLIPTSWIYYHVYGNLLAFAFTLCTVFIAISTTSMSGNEHFSTTHHKIGLTLLILTSVQVFNGMFRPNKARVQLPQERKVRNTWKVIHRLIGLIILCLGLFQVGDGLSMFSRDYNTINVAPLYFVLLIISIILVLGARLWLFVSGVDDKVFADTDDLVLETEAFDGNGRYPETEMT